MSAAVAPSPVQTNESVSSELPRVLCVDDEPFVLAVLQRMLRGKFDVHVTTAPIAALKMIEESASAPFAVIVSDLEMPGVSGITVLKRAREMAPDTVRILLTGHADIDSAIRVVNDGAVFQFLTKPCGAGALIAAVSAAAELHRLTLAEHVLLEQTLHGSVKALTDILTLVSPPAFARGSRLKRYVSRVGGALGVTNQWEIEIAALLSQLGSVALPSALVDKLHAGQVLDEDEQRLADGLPAIAASFIAEIPRLGDVHQILLFQNTGFDGSGSPKARVHGQDVPLGARILKVATDLDALEAGGMAPDVAMGTLFSRFGTYDPAVLAAFKQAIEEDAQPVRVRQVRLGEVIPGMVFANDVIGPNGLLLIARGQEVSRALTERIRYSMRAPLLDQTVVVIMPGGQA